MTGLDQLGRICALLAAAAICGLLLQPQAAQAQNKPPIAAPVTIVGVNQLPVVKSQTEVLDDFSAGAIPGLMADERYAEGLSLVAVRDDHVILRKDFGAVKADAPFDAGSLSDVLFTIAAMQQIEAGKMQPAMVAPALTYRQRGGPASLSEAIANASGQTVPVYVASHIFAPLALTGSKFNGNNLITTVPDMAQIMVALLHGGEAGQGRILSAQTVQTMQDTHYTLHADLPGWAYGFSEMRRNGWRALQHDGEGNGAQSRLVLVPEAKLGYLIVLKGHAGARFWHTLDNALFDRMFTPRGDNLRGTVGAVADAEQARTVADVYEPSNDAGAEVAPLKLRGRRLEVSAHDDGLLILSGAESGALAPRGQGLWSSADGTMSAALVDGRLVLNSGVYQRLAFWQRWYIYLWGGMAALFGAVYIFGYRRRRKHIAAPSNLVLNLLGGGTALLVVSLLTWLLSPAA